MMKCACKCCTNRFVGCHSSCADYAKYRTRVDSARKEETEWKRNERLKSPYKIMMMNKFADRGIDSRR